MSEKEIKETEVLEEGLEEKNETKDSSKEKKESSKEKKQTKNSTETIEENRDDDVEEYEEEFDGEKALSRMFEKRRFDKVLTRDQRREIYEKERVYGSHMDGFTTEKEQIIKETEMFRDAANSRPPKFLRGIVYGYEPETLYGPIVLVSIHPDELPDECTSTNYVVKIPLAAFMMCDLDRYRGEEGSRALSKIMKAYMDSEIDFIPFDLDEKARTVFASRVYASELIAQKNYVPKNGKKKYIKEGIDVAAKVVAVTREEVIYDVFGAEAVVKSEELSWGALNDLRQEFKVGQVHKVRVLKVEEVEYTAYNREHKLYKVEVSRRMAEPNPNEKYFNMFDAGKVYSGIVKSQNNFGVFMLVGDKVTVLCATPKSGTLERGSRQTVFITEKHEKDFRFSGKII